MSKIIVLFEVTPTEEGMEKYLELATFLKPMLSTDDGFISAERFSSLNNEGKLLSMNVWESEQAVEKWRNNMEHRASQAEGKNKLFKSYKITICNVLREYTDTSREGAPQDSNDYLL